MNKIEYLKKIRELYIVIDMVNGFVKEGNLAAPSIERVVPTQYKILDENGGSENGYLPSNLNIIPDSSRIPSSIMRVMT